MKIIYIFVQIERARSKWTYRGKTVVKMITSQTRSNTLPSWAFISTPRRSARSRMYVCMYVHVYKTEDGSMPFSNQFERRQRVVYEFRHPVFSPPVVPFLIFLIVFSARDDRETKRPFQWYAPTSQILVTFRYARNRSVLRERYIRSKKKKEYFWTKQTRRFSYFVEI